jgi:regulator of RNase E activity RraB
MVFITAHAGAEKIEELRQEYLDAYQSGIESFRTKRCVKNKANFILCQPAFNLTNLNVKTVLPLGVTQPEARR